VAEYAEAMDAGAKFPPIVVFNDGTRYLAADGFHRIHAARKLGATKIECDIRSGGKPEALKFALSCNAHHGLRRTNADKRHAVELALREFPKLSDIAIGDLCLVGRLLVAEIRKLQPVANQQNDTHQPVSSYRLNQPETRIGLDGRERRLPPVPTRPTEPVAAESEGASADQQTAAPTVPPPPAQVVDGTGWPVPTHLIPLWQRGGEVQEMLTALSRIRGALRRAQETQDMLYAEVSYSNAMVELDRAWNEIKAAKPFAVCPTCQGQVADNCAFCRGRGFVSEFRWDRCTTREDKELRVRAKQKAESEKQKCEAPAASEQQEAA
jgi:ParB-like chromosome segregation protein Spo0J